MSLPIVVLCQFLCLGQRSLHPRRKELGPSDGVYPHSVFTEDTSYHLKFKFLTSVHGEWTSDIPRRADFQECFPAKIHEAIHLLFGPLEVVDGEGVYGDSLDVES